MPIFKLMIAMREVKDLPVPGTGLSKSPSLPSADWAYPGLWTRLILSGGVEPSPRCLWMHRNQSVCGSCHSLQEFSFDQIAHVGQTQTKFQKTEACHCPALASLHPFLLLCFGGRRGDSILMDAFVHPLVEHLCVGEGNGFSFPTIMLSLIFWIIALLQLKKFCIVNVGYNQFSE